MAPPSSTYGSHDMSISLHVAETQYHFSNSFVESIGLCWQNVN